MLEILAREILILCESIWVVRSHDLFVGDRCPFAVTVWLAHSSWSQTAFVSIKEVL